MKTMLTCAARAALYCLHPRVVLSSLLPLAVCAGLTTVLAYRFWAPATDAVARGLQTWSLLADVARWLNAHGAAQWATAVAPLLVVVLSVPILIVGSLFCVTALMTPALVRLVVRRRFPTLETRGHAYGVGHALQGVAWTLVALLLLGVSLPLWLVPAFALLVPPLIWGWLTQRLLVTEILSRYADDDELQQLRRRWRSQWWFMGVVSGYLGSAPTLLWAASVLTVVLAPLLLIASVWLYTLVFAFSSLWFAHHALQALQEMRGASMDDHLRAAQPLGSHDPEGAPVSIVGPQP